MISTVYQLVNNMEANYAGKVAIQYYDEAKGGVVSIRYGQYAQDIRRAAGLLLHRDPDQYVLGPFDRRGAGAPQPAKELGRDPV